MAQGGIKFAAALLGTGLVVVPFMGLDSLPRDVRKQIQTERSALVQAQRDIREAQAAVNQDLQAEADLFRSIPASGQWPTQLTMAAAGLTTAQSAMQQLEALDKQNRRQDRDRAVALLSQEQKARSAAVSSRSAAAKLLMLDCCRPWFASASAREAASLPSRSARFSKNSADSANRPPLLRA